MLFSFLFLMLLLFILEFRRHLFTPLNFQQLASNFLLFVSFVLPTFRHMRVVCVLVVRVYGCNCNCNTICLDWKFAIMFTIGGDTTKVIMMMMMMMWTFLLTTNSWQGIAARCNGAAVCCKRTDILVSAHNETLAFRKKKSKKSYTQQIFAVSNCEGCLPCSFSLPHSHFQQ